MSTGTESPIDACLERLSQWTDIDIVEVASPGSARPDSSGHFCARESRLTELNTVPPAHPRTIEGSCRGSRTPGMLAMPSDPS